MSYNRNEEEYVKKPKVLRISDEVDRKESFDNEGQEGMVEFCSLNEQNNYSIQVPDKPEERLAWDSKVQFLMSIISYGVGLGNVWRFPYLCQQNGGGAFLIPYFIMMFVEGVPILLLELSVGQKIRLGSIGVWSKIHPWLGGIGLGSTVISFFVGIYYNMIIAWCLYYFFNSFTTSLPWESCPIINGTEVDECAKSSATAYYWYRNAMDISPGIEDTGGFKWWLFVCLVCAWIIVYLCMMRGIQSSGKVVYFTATFPYIVLVIFFARAITLKGSDAGLAHMFTPRMERLADPTVWLDAATQVFYSLGLAFGSLISFSSYNPPKNNCKRDAIVVSIVNGATSVFACVVVFAVLGFKATTSFDRCVTTNIDHLLSNETLDLSRHDLTPEVYLAKFNALMPESERCNLETFLNEAAEGTGLAFVVFTQAIVEFPGAPFWSIIFFMMLLTLGLGSMFGTLEGVVGNLFDLKLAANIRKEVLCGIICVISFCVGLLFCTGAGEYWVKVFDSCSGSMSLLLVALCEVLAVMYVYGHRRFIDEVEEMVGEELGVFIEFSWRFGSPLIMIVVFVASLWHRMRHEATYQAWNASKGATEKQLYPSWVSMICFFLVIASVLPIILVFVIRALRCQKLESDIPQSMKRIDTTVSTTGMMENMESEYRDEVQQINHYNTYHAGDLSLRVPGLQASKMYVSIG